MAVYAPPSASAGYGGFWIRVVAAIIDAIALSIIALPIRMIIFAVRHTPSYRMGPNYGENLGPLLAVLPLLLGANLLVSWLYEALMTSSSWQATLGKKALNLKVTDEAGNRISFARATGRHFAKYLSAAILFIGYIMVAFTERKRALHDMLAGTLVRKL
ncbi:MAG TPA: RDD family protein [Terriglobales bacterium]